jgi:hypothetical protein
MKMLYRAAEIRREIERVLDGGVRSRIVLVAYLGADAPKYLSNPQGLRVVCAPEAGATDPDAIRWLLKHGATVQFSDRLHMKVYWSRKGCVVCSANASSNGLSDGALKEAGVLAPASNVDIGRLLKAAGPLRPVRGQELRRLDRGKLARPRTRVGRPVTYQNHGDDYLSWYGLPMRANWKLASWATPQTGAPARVRDVSFETFGIRRPHTWVTVAKGCATQHDWLLTFRMLDESVTDLEWLAVDFCLPVQRSEKKFYVRELSFVATQVRLPRFYGPPPFRLDAAFRRAFRSAFLDCGDRLALRKNGGPTTRFLRLLADYLSGQRTLP